MTIASLIPIVLQTSVFLLVLSIGLNAAPSGALYLFRSPGKLSRAFLAMAIVVPAFAVTLALVLDLPHTTEVALVAIALSPVPPFLPLKAMKAGGQGLYVVGLLVSAAALSIIVIPLALTLIDPLFPAAFAMPPGEIAKLVGISVLAPLAVGMTIRLFAANLAERAARPILLLAATLLVIALIPVLIRAWPAILTLIGNGTVVTLAALVAVGLLAGHLLGGPDRDERAVLAVASGSRHPGVAIALAHANFPEDKLVLPLVLLYLVVASLVSLPYVQWMKRSRASPDDRTPLTPDQA
jgi:BASS family bile acid:Na+ symporter